MLAAPKSTVAFLRDPERGTCGSPTTPTGVAVARISSPGTTLSARTALCLWSGLGVYCLHLCSPPVGIRRSTAVNESPEDKARKWGVAGGLLRAATTRSAATTTTCQKIGGCLFFFFFRPPNNIGNIHLERIFTPPMFDSPVIIATRSPDRHNPNFSRIPCRTIAGGRAKINSQ